MATRDILVLNTTASRAETQQGSDTVRLKGTGEILSIENSSASPILSFKSDDSQTILEGKITSTGNLTGVITGSFGKVEGKTLIGSAAFLTNTDKLGTLSSSAQIASKITGSFRAGFQFSGTISGSGGSTGSFDKITATTFAGDASNLTNSQITNTLSSSAQIASDISGSFNKGFEFSGHISGSGASTGSFGRIETTTITGDGYELTNYIKEGTISSSAQIAADVSASFNKGFNFDGEISASESSSLSVNTLTAHIFVGEGSALTNTIPENTISRSAQLASDISGSFNKGFEYTGTIKGGPNASTGTWSVGGTMTRTNLYKASGIAGTGTKNAALGVGGQFSEVFTEEYDGTSWTEKNDIIQGRHKAMMTGTTEASIFFGGSSDSGVGGNKSCTEEWNGTNWSEVNDMILKRCSHQKLGITSEAAKAIGGQGNPADQSTVEDWNGSNWSAGTAVPATQAYGASTGTYDSGIVMGWSGTATYCWNGSAWSSVGTRAIGRYQRPVAAGTSNNAWIAGGRSPAVASPSYAACVEVFDGSSWSSGPDLPLAREQGGSADSLNTGTDGGMLFGGTKAASPNYLTDSLEFTDGSAPVSSSFGKVIATDFVGSGANITNIPIPSGILSSSAQLATSISGSFNKGFEFVGSISGSASSTGSFTHLKATTFAGDGSGLTNTALDGTVSSSAQIASDICGSFNKGFEYTGDIRTAKGVWSEIASLNTGRTNPFIAGNQNASLVAGGGNSPASPYYTDNSEEFDGSSWTEGDNMITAGRQGHASAGTQNAAVFAGGYIHPGAVACTEEYNGTSYATGGALNVARWNGFGAGTQTSALSVGGQTPSVQDKTELYDGNAFSQLPVNIGGTSNITSGDGASSNDALAIGDSPATTSVRQWDGITWFGVADTVENDTNRAATGTTTDFIAYGGSESAVQTTEQFDGSSWSVGGDYPIATLRAEAGSQGGGSSAWGVGGAGPAPTTHRTDAYHYNSYYTTGSFGRIEADDVQIAGDSQLVVSASLQLPVFTSNSGIVSSSAGQMWFNSTTRKLNFTMDVNAWSEISAQIVPRNGPGAIGSTGAFLSVGGNPPGGGSPYGSQCTELWDGTSWTELNDTNEDQADRGLVGNSSDALIHSGMNSQGSEGNELWNGTNWSSGPDGGSGVGAGYASGTANAAIIAGGINGSGHSQNCVFEWDGATFVAGGSMPTGRGGQGQAGSQNATYSYGGRLAPNSLTETTIKYNGTSWSADVNLPSQQRLQGGAGTQNAALAFGGIPAGNTLTVEYNGATWQQAAALGNGRYSMGGAGSQASAISTGGSNPAGSETYIVTFLKTVEIDGV